VKPWSRSRPSLAAPPESTAARINAPDRRKARERAIEPPALAWAGLWQSRINGTDGTDHGTATVALLVGGALNGGRVIADWPGLKPADLYENRDLKPTIDLRAVLKGGRTGRPGFLGHSAGLLGNTELGIVVKVLRDHLRADERVLAQSVFPGSKAIKAMAGLVG
jgi:uncharacterized protein (DUF1501 family)